MISISTVLQDIIKGNPFLEFGFHHGLFNLTQLARYLQPLVESRARKEAQVTAITMNLSRLQSRIKSDTPKPERFVIDAVNINSGLCAVTYRKAPDLHGILNRLYSRVHEESGFCSLSQGMHEITMVVENRHRGWLDDNCRQKPIAAYDHVAAVTVQFAKSYVDVPGMLYMLLQRVTLQNINLIEIASTYTEIMMFIDEADTRTIFDTLFQSFLVKSGSDSHF
ncbi:hypothetical protein [Aestuariispira insulae]|nr:hypothetical protein [Aestuariispira insulae]